MRLRFKNAILIAVGAALAPMALSPFIRRGFKAESNRTLQIPENLRPFEGRSVEPTTKFSDEQMTRLNELLVEHLEPQRELRVKPGQKSQILWAQKPRSELTLLYFHGFSASPQDTAPLMQRLSARLNANVVFQRMTGHGLEDPEQMGSATLQDWIHDAHRAMQVANEITSGRVIAIGMSTGSLYGLHLAMLREKEEYTNRLKGLVLLSPNFRTQAFGADLLAGPLGWLWAKLAIGSHRSFAPETPGHAELWTTRYPTAVLNSLMDLVRYIADQDLSQLKIPALCIYTPSDEVVSVEQIERRCKEMRAKLHALPEGTRHELTGEALSLMSTMDEIEQQILDFLVSTS